MSNPVNFILKQMKQEKPHVNIISYLPPVGKTATVALQVLSTQEVNPIMVSSSVSELFNNQVSIIPGTLKVLNRSQGLTTMSGMVTVNEIKKPIEGSTVEGFRCIARNLFMDDRDNSAWNKVETSEGKHVLVKKNQIETDQDMADLLSSISSVNVNCPEHRQLQMFASSVQTEIGTFLSFSYAGDHHIGFVVDQQPNASMIGILPFGKSQPVYTTTASVVQVFNMDEIKKSIKVHKVDGLATLSTQPSVDTMVDFYKKIYGENSEYFKKFAHEIRSYRFAR